MPGQCNDWETSAKRPSGRTGQQSGASWGISIAPDPRRTPPDAARPSRRPGVRRGTHPPRHDHGDGFDQPLEGDELVETEDLAGRHVQPVLRHHPCGGEAESNPRVPRTPGWDASASPERRTPKGPHSPSADPDLYWVDPCRHPGDLRHSRGICRDIGKAMSSFDSGQNRRNH